MIFRAFLALLHLCGNIRTEFYAKKNRHRKWQSAEKKGGEKVASSNEKKIYENMKSLEEWAFAGLSQKEMAEMLGMAYSTFRKLRGEIPALSALLKKSADFLKAEQKKEVESVEVSLLNRCLGYNADIKKHMKVKKPMLGAGEREGHHGGSAGGSDGAAAHPGGRRGNQILSFEQSKGQMEGEPRQAGAGEEARCERHEAHEACGAGGERRRCERKDDRRNLRGSGKRWSRCRGMTFYEMRRNTLKPFFVSRQRKARLCPSG